MPVRSLSSYILRWPDLHTVDQAVRRWAAKTVQQRRDVLRIGYFGSYARGDWGVGSDLDLIIVVEKDDRAFEKRTVGWDFEEIPVPVDALIYTEEEWRSLDRNGRFYKTLMEETVWVYVHR